VVDGNVGVPPSCGNLSRRGISDRRHENLYELSDREESELAKITFIGAGSTVFARNLLQDLFTFPELHNSTIALMDIDPVRLGDTEAVANLLADRAGAHPAIEATTDLQRALDGADYAINMIQVGGYRPST
jgi:alpha-galactosidase